MILITEAIKIIQRETFPLGSEAVALSDSIGRILAEDILTDSDLPPFDRSQMDGFAVIAKDTRSAPVSLKIVGESAAGKGWHQELKLGEAVRIMTGAPVPKGADAVQKMELTREFSTPPAPGAPPLRSGAELEMVEILQPAEKGKFIVPIGSEIKCGCKIFSTGEIITANMIAGIAAFGYANVQVSKQPTVAILPTGSEIVEIDQTPGEDQIRNSNSVMLKILAEKAGAVASLLPIAKDDIAELKSQIANAAEANDILIITGGVSVGKYDFTKAALLELGAVIFFDKVQLKPGKPTVFAKLGDTLIFGLPGNPVSAAVTFYLFVRMAILQMQNALMVDLKEVFAVLNSPVKALKERDNYLPATLETDDKARLNATPLKWLGSSDFIGFARAEVLIVVPMGKSFEKSEVVRIVYL